LNSKLDSGILDDYIQHFDFFCVSETMINDPSFVHIPGYTFVHASKKDITHKYGGIHGIGIFVKNSIYGHISVIPDTTSDSTLWIKIEETLLGYEVLLGAVYIPHENSVFHKPEIFDDLYNDIMTLSCTYNTSICLIGDFNSRTGNLPDFIESSKYDAFSNFENCFPGIDHEMSINNLNTLGFDSNRYNCDNKTNNNGYKLIDMCKNFDLRLVNGRVGNDKFVGDYTCISKNGNSTIDYAVTSAHILPNIVDFKIDCFDPCLSDKHKAIYFSLKPTYKQQMSPSRLSDQEGGTNNMNQSGFTKSPVGKTVWSSNIKEDYKNNFNDVAMKTLLDNLNHTQSSDLDQNSMDDICTKITDVLIEPAKNVGIFKINKLNAGVKTNSAITKVQPKPWFNFSCAKKRSDYLKLKNKLSKVKSDENINKIKAAANVYKKHIRKTKKEFYKNLVNDLRNKKYNDPKQFWNVLNKAENPKLPCPITIDKLFNHFRGLNSAEDNSQPEEFDPREIDHSINEFINSEISLNEVLDAKTKLKNNKAGGADDLINEFIIHSPELMLELICKLFNLVLDSGLIPSTWTLGIVIPIYKNKGAKNDPNNFRGITLLSSLGKLFTSILNTRLTNYIEGTGLLGEDQAGFRQGYSTLDHVFTLKCIIDIYLKKRKKLYCAFVDYKKAFDLINRSALWSKLIASGINGKVVKVIYNMYSNAKSCVKHNNMLSPYFNCNLGVRQGENLSPLLFALFLNDLEMSLKKDGILGLELINNQVTKYLSDDDIEMWLRLYLLLYADDTIIMAETSTDLQNALNSLHLYCSTWNLSVNTSKTKIVIFSRGKIRNRPNFYFGNNKIDICDDYVYLGVTLNYNGKFQKAIRNQITQAKRAMFALLTKAARLQLPVDLTCELFDKMVLPILLYGCEIWGYENCEQIEIFYRNFLKRVLKVHRFTTGCMTYGEVGKYKLRSAIDKRMVNYWSRLVTGKDTKYSAILYKLTLALYHENTADTDTVRVDDPSFKPINWIPKIKETFENCGLSFIWLSQSNHNPNWLKLAMNQRLSDIDMQNWCAERDNNTCCLNYRIYKHCLKFEDYLTKLDYSDRMTLCKFRCGNIKFPSNSQRFDPSIDKSCNLCDLDLIGDEFHYLFVCKYFNKERSKFLTLYFTKNPNTLKMAQLLNSDDHRLLKNLVRFIKIMHSTFE